MNATAICRMRLACIGVAVCSIGGWPTVEPLRPRSARAESFDSEFADGLRSRGLYRLAEIDGLARWRDSHASPDDRLDAAIDLIQTYAEWAVASPPAKRAALFAKAHALPAAVRERIPDHPRTLLVDLQDALAWLAAGEIARIEASGAAGDAPYENAKAELRAAVRGLEAVGADVERRLRELRLGQHAIDDAGLSADELDGLVRNVSVELARALKNQALCYEPDSADRVNALSRALERLRAPGVLNASDAIAWRGRVDAIACLRLLGRRDEAMALIHDARAANPSADVADRLASEEVRLLLKHDGPAAALAACDAAIAKAGRPAPVLDFARLEILLAMRRESTDSGAGQDDWARQITAQVERFRQFHSPAWTRRAEMLVGRAFASTGSVAQSGGRNMDALRLAAESLYRAGKMDEAIAAFDRAAETAGPDRASDQFAFQLSAAAIERGLGRIDAAGARYLTIAEQFPNHPDAEGAHRLAVLTAAEKIRAAATEADRGAATSAYESLLRRHLDSWPNGATADDAWFWLGSLYEGTHRWDAAQDALWRIRPSSERFSDAVERGARAVLQRLEHDELSADDRAALVANATAYLQPIITGADGAWPETWSPLQLAVARPLARIQFRFAEDSSAGAEYARRLLTTVLTSENANASWSAGARALLVEVLLAQGKPNEAAAELAKIPADQNESLLPIVRNAPQLLRNVDAATQISTAEVLLQVVARLDAERDSLTASAAADVDAAKAAVLAAQGRMEEAVGLYRKLTEANPRSGPIQRALAELLSQSNDPADLQAAARAWRRVEQGSKPGGALWFQARIHRCETLVRQGRTADAQKLLRLTRALHPDLGGDENRRAIERLEASLRSN